MSEQDDSLIEQLRSYGISLEDLEGLIRGKVERRPNAAPESSSSDLAIKPGAFDSLDDLANVESKDAMRSFERTARDAPVDLSAESVRSDADRTRDLAIADAKRSAADIRANAVKLVTEKLQAAEDEVAAMRAEAAEDATALRRETSRAMLARLKDAQDEAELLRTAARDEMRRFWESAYREFSIAKQEMGKVRGGLADLVASMSDAVSSMEQAATSIAELCAHNLEAAADRFDEAGQGTDAAQ